MASDGTGRTAVELQNQPNTLIQTGVSADNRTARLPPGSLRSRRPGARPGLGPAFGWVRDMAPPCPPELLPDSSERVARPLCGCAPGAYRRGGSPLSARAALSARGVMSNPP